VTLLAAAPILLLLALMLGWRWPAARAGGVAAALTAAIALFAFDLPGRVGTGAAEGIAGVGAEAGFTALTILWIIGPALGIYQLQLRTGSAEVLRDAMGAVAPDPRLLALLIAWFFALFMEGAAGFGASVALAAPFLVAAGFAPVAAVTAALIGHAVGVSFGAIGTPIMPQVAATGLTGAEIARATGIYHTLLGWIPLIFVVLIAQRATAGETRRAGIAGWTAAAALCFLVPYTLLWRYVGPELPTIGGALFGGAAFVLLLRWRGRAAPGEEEGPVRTRAPAAGAVARAAAPYLVLVTLVLLTRLVGPLGEALRQVSAAWTLHGVFSGAMQPLHHPGSMLLAGFVAGAVLQRAGRRMVVDAVMAATRTLVPVAVALVSMLFLSRLMVHAGMTERLAHAAAAGLGGTWPLVAPYVGVLGTFVTGSATASNILFTDFQQETALAVGRPVAGVVGAQGFGAAVGNIVCPHNVVAAGATVGLAGREGEILRRTLPVALLYATLGGFLALALVR
jgi:lactate permease